ncbi:MAG TPA: hypothetical protein G4O00_01605 [Thermoflexia bacterium]|nr:hypothetical protein [Thermoflexia bacterium]
MSEIEQKGAFYLGREYDLKAGEVTDRPVFYPARHLTTHAVFLGMTGSGKTGLGLILLEEALLQGTPVIAIDPKGDVTNLLLTFPSLSPEAFEPWVDAERAQRKGLTVQQAAEQAADLWRKGLADWGIGPDRLARLREGAEFVLYTPGSKAGVPVNVLHRFDPPALDWETHEETLRERIQGLVTALLSLVGREADPLQSPEHVLLSLIVEHVWRSGQGLDLPTLIRLIQQPPVRQVGVFDLESFLPEKERTSLARALNNIFASPGFEVWREGTPLEIGPMLRTDDGRPRANIFYLPHLDDTERHFFVTLLLEAVRDWMAAQSGTSDLRAILYFDEVFGFFPPHPANPPTKQPLMALIKQGRAAGLGVVLSTQNPADLDYKGLTNAGTWAVGTLRTDRDKNRVLEGLEGATEAAGVGFDRASLDKAITGLRSRVFLLHDIRADAPVFFHTRWAMSYLRGPLTRTQVRQLVGTQATQRPAAAVPSPAAPPPPPPTAPAEPASSVPPTLPSSVPQIFLPAAETLEWALRQHEERTGKEVVVRSKRLVYQPRLLAVGTVYLEDERKGVRHQETVARLVEPPPPPAPVNWEEGEVTLDLDDLSHEPVGEGAYLPVPAHMTKATAYKRWTRAFSEYLYRNIRITIWYNPALKLYGKVGETRRDFRLRCEKEARERRDAEIAKAKKAMDKKMQRVQEKLRREQRELAEDQAELEARKREELLTLGESALGFLTGRRSRILSTASRKRRLTKQAEADVRESEEAIKDLEAQLKALAEEWQEEVEEINDRWAATLEEIEVVEVAPRRRDVVIDYCGLAWVPEWEVETEDGGRIQLAAFEWA